jgi:hypothetical protein
MKHGGSAMKKDSHPRPRSLLNLCSKALKQGLDVSPLDVARDRLPEDGGKGLVLLFRHRCMIACNASSRKRRRLAGEGGGLDSSLGPTPIGRVLIPPGLSVALAEHGHRRRKAHRLRSRSPLARSATPHPRIRLVSGGHARIPNPPSQTQSSPTQNPHQFRSIFPEPGFAPVPFDPPRTNPAFIL